MASTNESNSLLSSCNDKSMSKKHLNEHEETIKSDQMASKKSLSNDGEEQIASMDENDLKNLLDEALTYKNPRDANEKSETFKRLLQNVTEEEEHKRKFESNSLHWKAQSNSLQNLLDESHYQLQNHQSQISSKKHQQRRKNSTSVSTRRLEGGSLPVDMHHSSAIQSPPDQPFLSEFKNNKKRKEKQQAKDTVIDMLDIETDDTRKSFQKCLDPNTKDTTTYQDGMIELKSLHANRVEMEIQDQSSSKFTTANSTPNTITTIESLMTGNPIPTIMSSKSQTVASTSSVDQVIPFSTLEKPKSYQQAQTMDYYNPSTINHSNNIPLTGGGSSNYSSTSSERKCVGGGVIDQQALQLPSGVAVNSVMDPKTFSYPKFKTGGATRDDVSSLIQTTPSILPTSHSSTTTSNSKDSKASKKRTAKSERNEKNINVQSIEGYRGNDTLEELLTYIDGQHNNDGKGQKNHPKNGIVSNNNNNSNLSNNNNNNNDKQANEQLLNADDKKKKMVSKNKEKMNKLKKSNSMDELCSTGRQQEKEKSSVVNCAAVESSSSSSTANKIVQDVTLRSKNNANNSNSNSNMTSGAKKVENKTDKSQTKRNERRSWGTEGLWPDTSAATNNDIINSSISTNTVVVAATGKSSATENQDDNQENESSSSSSSSGVHNLDFITSDPINTTSNFETINPSSEADKFQVVIKKKKVKRKSSENTDSKSSVQTTSNNLQSYAMRRDGNFRAGTKSSTSNSNNNNNNNNNNMGENSRADKNNAANKNPSKQMSQDAKQNSIGKNRRKSTSSMPDEDGEYSDGGDSVQSLPIETTKPLSSLLSAPTNNNNTSAENSGKTNSKKNNNKYDNASNIASNPVVVSQISPSQQQQQIISIQQQQQKPTTFSYADIAKTNTNRTNNNNNNVIPASTEKMWPSISSSSSSTHQHNNNNNNVNDPFAISSFDAISSRDNNSNNTNNNNNLNSVSNTATNLSLSSSSATKQQQVIVNQQQQKSTPQLKNTMSFPELVESNNNRNKQLNNNPLDLTFNGDATQTEKSLNGLERAFDNNNNPSTTATTFTITHDRLNNINNNNNNANNASKISYSQSLLENHNQEIDANGNNSSNINTKLENAITVATTVTSNNNSSNKNTLTKSKSVDHNNLSIEHYPALEKTKQTLSDVLSKPIESLSNKVMKVNMIKVQHQPQQQQIQLIQNNNPGVNLMRATVETINVKDDNGNGTKKKKDKLALRKSTSTVSTSTMSSNQQNSNNLQTTQISNNIISSNNIHHHSRPAVIIMNDCEKTSDGELGITFGFDINEHLLFGNHNGDVVMADMDQSVVEMNSTNKYDKIKNNSNCDIMNTNLSSNTINLNNNLTNQSCGFEIYENFISSPPQSVIDHSQQQQQQMIHQVTIIQSSPKINSSNNNNSVKENSTILLDTSNQSLNDLGYMSSSLITNSTTSPANQKLSNDMQQHPNSDNVNQYENEFGHQTSSYPNSMDIKQRMKLDELVSRFVSPEPAKNFNYDELVTFVSEEWTKVERNGVYFNGQ